MLTVRAEHFLPPGEKLLYDYSHRDRHDDRRVRRVRASPGVLRRIWGGAVEGRAGLPDRLRTDPDRRRAAGRAAGERVRAPPWSRVDRPERPRDATAGCGRVAIPARAAGRPLGRGADPGESGGLGGVPTATDRKSTHLK